MKTPLVMLAITSGFIDEDGVLLQHSTWAVGYSPTQALKAWKRACPGMACNVTEVRTVTPNEPPPDLRLRGPRLPRGVVI